MPQPQVSSSKVVPLEGINEWPGNGPKGTVPPLIAFGMAIGSIISGLLLYLLIVSLNNNYIFTSPCLSIESINAISPINITYPKTPSSTSLSSSLTGSWNISFGYRNQAHVKITYYDSIDVTLYYRNVSIGHTTTRFSKIYQGKTQTWIHMATKIDADSVRLADMVAYHFAQDMNDGTTKYEVAVVAHVRVIPCWRFRGKSTLKFHIDTRVSGFGDCIDNFF